MFEKLIFVIFGLVHIVYGAPQLISFEDGKIGVNFGGFHASAGLGGILTGNAAHGGLSASAGTPYGQKAVAGLGGFLDGQTSGGAYAGATAGHGVGAGALLGGNVGSAGGSAGIASANSYAGGVSKQVTIVDEKPPKIDAAYTNTFSVDKTVESIPQDITYVQKIKKIHHHPHKVYYTEIAQPQQTQTDTQTYSYTSSVYPKHTIGLRKLFNFGLFANKGLFGRRNHGTVIQTTSTNVQQHQQQPETVVVPQVIYEKRVVPKVVYEKRIVPEVIVEKKVVPQTIKIEKPVVVTQHHIPKFSIHKEISIGKNVGVGANAGAAVGGDVSATAGAGVGGSVSSSSSSYGSTTNIDFSKRASTLIDDIFNIPISTLQAVNRLVGNKIGQTQGNINIQKTIEINKN